MSVRLRGELFVGSKKTPRTAPLNFFLARTFFRQTFMTVNLYCQMRC